MERSPLHQQIDTLPDLVRVMVDRLTAVIPNTLSPALCANVRRVFVTGCGDSHHAALNSELAFEQLAGLPCEPMTAMQFGRYAARFLPDTGPGRNLVLAISVSGQVSRTAEALALGRKAGGLAVALTGNPAGALAKEAEVMVETAVPPLPDETNMVVPGTRSYVASQLALYLTAVHLGELRGHLTHKAARQARQTLAGMADAMEETIARSDPIAQQLAADWLDGREFVFCGAGPNVGTALFSAAKLIEAAGDTAVAQDTEEWAHLQYFGRQADTPTLVISAEGWDASRAREVVTAAAHIGRRVAVIGPDSMKMTAVPHLPLADSPGECFSPLLACLPGTLFAAYRAQFLGEPYFRGFGGGRSVTGGGGISRIRSSQRMDQ
ncbi:MAG: SIS domain-containing protein [Chloroflexi bacterium]|nr:SIS domain-containing protein [Chloroflexota bacterium]